MATLQERLAARRSARAGVWSAASPSQWRAPCSTSAPTPPGAGRAAGVQVLEGNLVRVLRTDPAFPAPARRSSDGKELRALSREVMRSYARYYLETFRMQVIPVDRIAAGMHVNIDQADLTLEYMKNGRGVIYALPHMGDFEQAGLWINRYGAGSFTTVAERLEPEAVFQMWLDFRQGLGMEVLPTTGGPHPFGVMAQRLRAGKLVCLVADRDLSDTGVEVDFFGEKALFPAGPGVPGDPDRRGADAGRLLVRGRGRVGRAHLRRDPGPGRGHPQGEGRRDDPGDGDRLRGGDPRAPGRLAHAAEGLRQRPRPRAPGPQPQPPRRNGNGRHQRRPDRQRPTAAPRRAANASPSTATTVPPSIGPTRRRSPCG